MEVIQKRIKCSRSDRFDIIPFGDLHAGSIHCSESEARAMRDKIRDSPNTYWVGMGDLADSITKNDKRFDIGGLAPWVKPDDIIESQRKWLVELLKPIKDKCLGLLTGNHEETIHLNHQDDITRHLCNDLGVRYAGYSCFIVLDFTRGTAISSGHVFQVIIHAWHGAGAAQTEGARMMRLVRLVNDIQADIYFMGHLHAMEHITPDRLILKNGRVKSVKLAATITGSWLKAYTQPHGDDEMTPSYAEMKGFKPSRIGAPVVHIWPARQEFTIEG